MTEEQQLSQKVDNHIADTIADEDLSRLVHDVREHLNSIVMNAELAHMLSDKTAGAERISRLMDVVISQCGKCDQVIEAFRRKHGTGG